MAVVSGITAVKPTDDTQVTKGQYGEAVAIGDAIYLDQTEAKYFLADANVLSKIEVFGIAITPGSTDDHGLIASNGTIQLVGTTLTVAQQYILSPTPGKLQPATDRTTGDYITNIGTASSTTLLKLDINSTGIQVP